MYGKFIVEGDKLVSELLTSNFGIEAIFKLPGANIRIKNAKTEVFEISEDELKKISTHESPNLMVAIAEMPAWDGSLKITAGETGPFIVCDNLNDPGNAGTIIRTADWFGIKKVFLSENSVDIYNPKAVSAAKGSLFRTGCVYVDIKRLFTLNKNIPVYGAFMDGENIYSIQTEPNSFILIGNEANGIRNELLPFINRKISIPPFGHAESLNAGVAAGIIMSEFKRGIKLKFKK